MTRQQERAQLRRESKRVAPERGLRPSGIRPTHFVGQTEMNPVGFLATRANLRNHWYRTKKSLARARRETKVVGDKLFVRHETKGWMSARIAA